MVETKQIGKNCTGVPLQGIESTTFCWKIYWNNSSEKAYFAWIGGILPPLSFVGKQECSTFHPHWRWSPMNDRLEIYLSALLLFFGRSEAHAHFGKPFSGSPTALKNECLSLILGSRVGFQHPVELTHHSLNKYYNNKTWKDSLNNISWRSKHFQFIYLKISFLILLRKNSLINLVVIILI